VLLGDAEFFESEEAANQIDLAEIANPTFLLDTPEDSGITATLVELKFSLKQKNGPRFVVCSKNVLETLEFNGLRRKLDGDSIAKAVLKITFPDEQRGKRVELSGPNKLKFKRATHADDVFQLLKDWCLLVTEEEDEDTVELRIASAKLVGVANSSATRTDELSPTGTTGPRAEPRAK